MTYTILTTLIIILGKLRDRIPSPKSGGMHLRYDRCIPYPKDFNGNLYMSCCDCGLVHFFIPDHSGTPVRPRRYAYRFRLGSKAWHEPDSNLINRVEVEARSAGVIK